jgi:post-segregation antitoxin (ccd killing protein)
LNLFVPWFLLDDELADASTKKLNLVVVAISRSIWQSVRLAAERRSLVWVEDHAEAIKDANEFLQRRGLWSDGKRQF